MPKVKSTFSSKFSDWMKTIEEDERKFFVTSDKDKIFCNVCSKVLNCNRKFQLDQHIGTGAHQASVKRSKGSRQLQVTDESAPKNFSNDLCKAFLAADIPLKKLENPVLKSFLEDYCKQKIPSIWTVRNKYVPMNYNDVTQRIQLDLKDEYIWMGVDETTDKRGRFVANVMVGCLHGSPSKPHLLMSQELTTADNSTVTQLILDALHFLWPGKRESDISKQFAVLLSDAAPYMVKAGKNLKATYPGLLHVTCLAHGLHRVAETVRASYKNVDKLLGTIKAVFKKSPYRVRKYNELLPGLRLPPEPVLTRWGTWLESVEFLSEHFDGVKSVIQSLDDTEAECIRKAHKLLGMDCTKQEVAEITSNFGFLSNAIKKLETRNLTIMEATEVVSKAKLSLSSNVSRNSEKVNTKLDNVLKKNPDFDLMERVANVLRGNREENLDLDPGLIVALKYCPLTSVEVERGFSQCKAILTDRRCVLTMKNIEMHNICHFEMNLVDDSNENCQ